jgi:hypothetical protein
MPQTLTWKSQSQSATECEPLRNGASAFLSIIINNIKHNIIQMSLFVIYMNAFQMIMTTEKLDIKYKTYFYFFKTSIELIFLELARRV